jgi:formate/nitrite transporter FocA (FNT family)
VVKAFTTEHTENTEKTGRKMQNRGNELKDLLKTKDLEENTRAKRTVSCALKAHFASVFLSVLSVCSVVKAFTTEDTENTEETGRKMQNRGNELNDLLKMRDLDENTLAKRNLSYALKAHFASAFLSVSSVVRAFTTAQSGSPGLL